MQFSLLSIEVDGTLRNPYVLAGLAVWTAQLSIAMAIFLHNLYARRLRFDKRWLLFGAVLGSSYFIGRIACRMVSTFLYIILTPQITSIGYWGTAPFWVPPVVAGMASLTYALIRKRIHNDGSDGEQLAAADRPPGGR